MSIYWNRHIVCIILISMIFVIGHTGCESTSRTQKGAIFGGLGGATVGGLIGSKKGNTATGALIGGVVGALTGGLIGNYMDKQAQELASVAEVKRVDDGIIVTMRDKILFDTGQSTLLPGSKTSLIRISEVIKKYNKTEVTIAGHTDNVGTASFNQGLSERRANSVQVFLVGQGVAPSRMKPVGFGFDRPIASNSTQEGRAQNRRVELHISPDAALVRDAEASAK